MLTLHESLREDGSIARVSLELVDGATFLVDDEGRHPLPDLALDRVMRRYGKELAIDLPRDAARLDFPDGSALVRFRHKTIYDVIAKDWLAFVPAGGGAPLAELSTSVSAALAHLSRASAARDRKASP